MHAVRCVSKNIFIGVVASEGRLDNYVGCDKCDPHSMTIIVYVLSLINASCVNNRYGWAFLANKAVWHNKSKLRTYGDLFRSGDTVTISVDLDVGRYNERSKYISLTRSSRGRKTPTTNPYAIIRPAIICA